MRGAAHNRAIGMLRPLAEVEIDAVRQEVAAAQEWLWLRG